MLGFGANANQTTGKSDMKQIHKAGMVIVLSLAAANVWAEGTLDAVMREFR